MIVLKEGDIRKLDDDTYHVTKAWFLYRMNLEQKLKEKLIECRSQQP